MQILGLVFTGIASLGLLGGFGFEFYRFRKYRNWKYLNTDLILLFLLAGVCLMVSAIASMWDTASGSNHTGRKGIWLGFSTFMCSVCSWLLKGWFKNRKRVKRISEEEEIISEPSIPLDDEEDKEEILQDSDQSKEFEIFENEKIGDIEDSEVEGLAIDIPTKSATDEKEVEEVETSELETDVQ